MNKSDILKTTLQVFHIISRTVKSNQKIVHMKNWEPEMVKYGHIKYYPRFPNHKDPEFKPSKAFLIQRVKKYTGQPHWDKRSLDILHLNSLRGKPFTIVKNTPDMCARLWSIKHLLKITPIDIPDNFSEEDAVMGGTFLHENGKLEVIQKVDPVRIEKSVKFQKQEKKMDKVTIKRQLRLKWLNPIE